MKTLTKDQFEELQEEFGEKAVRLYSGRAMWGAECLGYEGDYEFGEFVVKLAIVMNPQWADHMEDGEFLLEQIGYEVGKLMSSLSSDAMGNDAVHYWRGITVEGAQKSRF